MVEKHRARRAVCYIANWVVSFYLESFGGLNGCFGSGKGKGQRRDWCCSGDNHGGVDMDAEPNQGSPLLALIPLAGNKLEVCRRLTLLPYLAYALNVLRAVDILADML